ncbi:glucose-6-phosphate isomerase [Egicoccus sp. AB-alg6-2]|uniref:glucose-6-phosphate isomerase n=1 Tax=Egicoccus sp. AB-alg6-2 TaxID=3242692 RepID=UPI00359DCE0A
MTLGPLTDAVAEATARAMAIVPRIWDRDHTVWRDDPTEISDRLGWLDAPSRADEVRAALERVAADVVADGITDVLLVGMGGSSLYPEVLATTYGPAAGFPRLRVLDSVDPAAVRAVEQELPWQATLLVPASKSGGTIEMACHLARFRQRLEEVHGAGAGDHIVPITDPGSALEREAREQGYRTVVHGQPDVGGRFSALTPFGLLPAALLGIDLDEHLAPARNELAAARSSDPESNGPAVLGATLAAAHRAGRDKLVLVLPEEVRTFGLWVEQLVAESTGKGGMGVLPVLEADLDGMDAWGDDRLVVVLGETPDAETIARAGHPVVQLPWSGPGQLAGEVVRWEFATAVAGALLGINPFDQPDVQSAKTATDRVLDTGEDVPPAGDPDDVLGDVVAGDYVALLGFVTPGGAEERSLHAAAARLRRRLGVPVTVGIGPRYLHSTGQLHKGGPDTGRFLVVVGDDDHDVEIPGRAFTFGRLKRAQAAGDLAALRAAGRRAVRITPEELGRL